MSYYASTADLSSYLGTQTSSTDPGTYEQVTDRINATTVNATAGQEALEAAEVTIDSYLAFKFAVPIDVAANARVATLLKSLTVRIAAFQLFASSPFMEDVIDRIEKLYDDCLRFLKGIKDGTTTLPGVSPLAPAAVDGPQVIPGGNCRVFTEDTLSSF